MLRLWFPVLTQDRVHEQYFPPVHVWREFGVVDFGFLRLLVALDEDLADANWATAVPQALLHGFTCVGTNTDASVTECVNHQTSRRAKVVGVRIENIYFLPRVRLLSFLSDLVLMMGERCKLVLGRITVLTPTRVIDCIHVVSWSHLLGTNFSKPRDQLKPPAHDTAQHPPIRTYSTAPKSSHDTILHNVLQVQEFHGQSQEIN